MYLLRLAWRNIWRNKRRSLVTIASVFFAVFFAILMREFHMGSWQGLLDGVLNSYSGYLQIHNKGFWKNRTFDYTMEESEKQINSLKQIKGVKQVIPRLEGFAFASSGAKTKGILLLGIDSGERHLINVEHLLVDGRYFNSKGKEVIVGQRLAHFFDIKTNDTLVLISQGYQGNSAADKFVVIGIAKLPAPEFDNQVAFTTLSTCQEFYSANNRITSYCLVLKDNDQINEVCKKLKSNLPNTFEIMSWKEMLRPLWQQFQTNIASGMIILLILYLIIGFGIFGTLLMMVSERQQEFGVLISIGMQKYKLAIIVAIETLHIALIGTFLGIIGSIPVIIYFHHNPIKLTGDLALIMQQYGMEPVIPIYWGTKLVIEQSITVFGLAFLAFIIPLIRVLRTNEYNALHR
jgi:putative ABC transport system permease protein